MGAAEDTPTLRLGDLEAVSVLGRGAKGLVFLVRPADESQDTLALKVVSRSTGKNRGGGRGGEAEEDPCRRIWFERDVLASLRHPLLPSLRGTVSCNGFVGFAIQHCPGGNLATLRQRQSEKMFSDDVIRFYAAEMVLALEHLHGLGIVYRDLKPENVLIQSDGHLMLVDFDLSTRLPPPTPSSSSPPAPSCNNQQPRRRRGWWRSWSRKSSSPGSDREEPLNPSSTSSSSSSSSSSSAKSNSFVGTEEYVAPEVVEGSGHDHAVDWWGLGVVLYEMLYGRTPFRGQNRKETFYRVLTKEPELVGERTPLKELIGRLLEKDPRRRIGVEGIKGHEFFRGADWEEVLGIGRPPFIPAEVAAGGWWGEGEEEEEGIDVERFVHGVFGDDCSGGGGWEGTGGMGGGRHGSGESKH